MLDNTILGVAGSNTSPVVLNSMAGFDARHPSLGTLDLIALDNRFDAGVEDPYAFRSSHRSHVFDRDSVARLDDVVLPPFPSPVTHWPLGRSIR